MPNKKFNERFDPLGNLPANLNDQNSDEPFYEDSRSLMLSHYVMAERCLQVEYATIADSIRTGMTDDNLVYILEGGFRGFHKFTREEIETEYKEIEEKFYDLYETNSLPWEVYDEDPLVALEEDENGEVACG